MRGVGYAAMGEKNVQVPIGGENRQYQTKDENVSRVT